jgi:hypothetical protein
MRKLMFAAILATILVLVLSVSAGAVGAPGCCV